MVDYVVLVNKKDQVIGTMEKMEAHQKGLLHRAFSVFIFNSKGEMLLQRRALKKYHSPGLWTNTCCSHPYPLEIPEQAAVRRLNEEMNIGSALHFAPPWSHCQTCRRRPRFEARVPEREEGRGKREEGRGKREEGYNSSRVRLW